MDSDLDPLLCTYVIEEAASGDEWYTLEEAASLAGVMGASWIAERVDRNPELETWLASGYRKHLRRAKTKDFEKLAAEIPGAILEGPYGRLFASELHFKSETPKVISRLQLSGFKESERRAKVTAAPLDISINSELGMSFGKASIAAAHAAQNLFLKFHREPNSSFISWKNHGYAAKASQGSVEPSSVQYAQVEDFGLTEVPAGSITAVAQLR